MVGKILNNVKKIGKGIRIFLTNDIKMKLLVAYIVLNLLYITIGSYIFMTKQINPQFNYKQFSLGLRNILIVNVIVFLVICFRKHYKKNLAHLGILAIAIVRWNFNLVCI